MIVVLVSNEKGGKTQGQGLQFNNGKEGNDISLSKINCAFMFIVALFTMAKKWNQPKCPSADEWVKKMYAQ